MDAGRIRNVPRKRDCATASLLPESRGPWRSAGRACNAKTICMGNTSVMVKATTIDAREFARFFISGIAATIGNILTVKLARSFLSFETALLPGIAVGITISFGLSKFFAFRSRSLNRTAGEVARFLIVYATGCAIYWLVAVFIRIFLLALGLTVNTAEPAGILVGGGTMMLTSYCGHRFFTYRTYRRQKRSDRAL
jgi:putative flippase GtrA